MKQSIKETMGYDDPSRKKISESEIILRLTQAYVLMNDGLKELEFVSRNFAIDEKLRNTLQQSMMKIIEELTELNEHLIPFIHELGMNKVQPIDKIIAKYETGNPNVSLNESTQQKIDQTIKRIIEVNKKLNHGR